MRIRRTVKFQTSDKGDHDVGTVVVPSDIVKKLGLKRGQELSVKAAAFGRNFHITYEGVMEAKAWSD